MSVEPDLPTTASPALAAQGLPQSRRLSWAMRGLVAGLFAAAVAVVLVTNTWLT